MTSPAHNPLIRPSAAYAGRAADLAASRGQAGTDQAAFGRELREQAEKLVSSALIMPVMGMIRNEPFKTELFHGGSGERMFGQMLDQRIADSMAGRIAGPIVDTIYNAMAARGRAGVQIDG